MEKLPKGAEINCRWEGGRRCSELEQLGAQWGNGDLKGQENGIHL
jgi:hypothetical protein